jgi:hypothetical protein
MSEPCKHCGEYHSCTDLIDQQAKEKEFLQNQSSELAKEVMYFQEQNGQLAKEKAELEKCLIVEQEHNLMLEEKQSEPVAWKQIRTELNNEGDVIGEFSDIRLNVGWEELPHNTPLYTTPQKYCPSENNAAYEKGFIDGMAKQRDSSIDRALNNGIIGQIGDNLIHDLVHRTPQTRQGLKSFEDWDNPVEEATQLSDEEIEEIYQNVIRQPNFMMLGDTIRFARAIEAKLRGEK